MKGAMAEVPPNTIKRPMSANTIMTGASHHFFRSLMKSHRSLATVMPVSSSQRSEQELCYQRMRCRVGMLVPHELVLPVGGVDVGDDLMHLEDLDLGLAQPIHDQGVIAVVASPHDHAELAAVARLEQLLRSPDDRDVERDVLRGPPPAQQGRRDLGEDVGSIEHREGGVSVAAVERPAVLHGPVFAERIAR